MKKKNGNNKQSYIFTRETLGMTLLLFCALVLVALLAQKYAFASLGTAICTFMYGTFGYASFIVVAALAYLGIWLVFEKKINCKARTVAAISATVFSLFLLFHSVTTRTYDMSNFGGYLSQCYSNAELGYAGYSFGGALCGLIVYPIAKITTYIGAYVIFSLLTVLCGYITYLVFRKNRGGVSATASVKDNKKEKAIATIDGGDPLAGNQPVARDNMYSVGENNEIIDNKRYAYQQPVQPQENQIYNKPYQQPVQPQASQTYNTPLPDILQRRQPEQVENKYSDKDLGRRILFDNGDFAAESYRRNMIFNENSYFNHPVQNENDYLSSFSDGKPKTRSTPVQNQTYSESYSNDLENTNESVQMPSYVFGDKPVDHLDDIDEADDYTYDNHEGTDAYRVEEDYSSNIRGDIEEPQVNDEGQIFAEQIDEAGQTEPIIFEDYYADGNAANKKEDTSVGSRRSERDTYEEAIRTSPDNSSEDVAPRATTANDFKSLFSSTNTNLTGDEIKPDTSRLSSRRKESNANLFDDAVSDTDTGFNEDSLGTRGLRSDSQFVNESRGRSERNESIIPERDIMPEQKSDVSPFAQPQTSVAPAVSETKQEKPKHVWKKYVRPTLDLLRDYPENKDSNQQEIEESKSIIVETLANFRIASHISDVVIGPAITRYDVVIEDKTNIKNAMRYREAIAMALMKENVTAYLNYTKGAISIEVPNSNRATVGLKTMLTSSQFINCKPNTLTFALGKDVDGKANCPDITKMPHLLVAGTTGSGKSICLNSLIISLLYKYGPDELRFILVDPKQSEFIAFENLPHLMINEIIYNDVDKAIKALNWAIKEMERRYAVFKDMTLAGTLVKNINEYNANLPEGEEKMPKIVIILDEFGDLMLQAKKDIESRIIRLVQKSRACGIHLILATQRPSVDCITGLIKSNLPTRIGFKVNSFDDSRTIFDIGGGEKLLGKGDMYFRSAENPDLTRIQGCFIDSPEVQAVTDFVKKNNESYFDQSIADFINTVEEDSVESSGGDDAGADAETKIDDKYIQALKFCVESNQASVSMLQRRFPIGYVKACKIIDWMENMNYITQSEGSKPRKVLLTMDEFKRIFGDVDD